MSDTPRPKTSVMPPFLALVQRELLRTLRKIRAIFLIATLVVIASWVLIEQWPGENAMPYTVAWSSESIVGGLAITLYIAGLLLMPAYGATSLVVEREQHTYDLLTLSLIRPAGVVMGKLFNTLGMFALLAIAVLPLLATAFFLVGVDWLLLLTLCPIIALTAFWAAAVGVMCSARLRSTVAAVLVSYLCVVALLGIYMIPIVFLAEVFNMYGLEDALETVAPVLASPVSLVYTLDGEFSVVGYIMFLLVQTAYGLFALFVAWLAVRRPRESRLPGEPRYSRVRDGVRSLFRLPVKHRPLRGPIPDYVNPMFAKERLWGWHARRKLWLFAFLGVAGLETAMMVPLWLILISEHVSERDAILSFYWMIMSMAVVALVTPALLANTLTKEYERENVDALRMTLLRPSQIIFGKARSGFRAAVPFLAATVLGGILVVVLTESRIWPWKLVIVVDVSLIVSAILIVGLSLFASMLTRRTPAAILLSYALGWMVMFGFFWLAWLADMTWNQHYTDAYYAAVAFCSPMAGCVYHLYAIGFPERANSLLGPDLITNYWVVNVLFHLAFGIALLLICTRAFRVNRMHDR